MTKYNELKTNGKELSIIMPCETEYTHLVDCWYQMGGHQCGT